MRAAVTANANSILALKALKLLCLKSVVIKIREIVNWKKNSVVQADKLRKRRNNVSDESVLK